MPPRHPDAIIPPPEEIVVSTKRVACDGGGGALGHPLVYMDMGEDDSSNAAIATVASSCRPSRMTKANI